MGQEGNGGLEFQQTTPDLVAAGMNFTLGSMYCCDGWTTLLGQLDPRCKW